jgi:AmpD protein
LHAISLPQGVFTTEYIIALFCGRLDCSHHATFCDLVGLRVSAHYLVDRQGGVIQFVADKHRAWHTGNSSWQGREQCNDYSIGIEIVGDERSPFTLPQYRTAAQLSHHLMMQHSNITANRIVGHADISPSRKWDPGQQWNWSRFRQCLDNLQ